MNTMNLKKEYKTVVYNHINWVRDDGTEVNRYVLNDKNLLKHTSTIQIEFLNEFELLEKIEWFLDNEEYLIKSKILDYNANVEFYETLNYKGD